MNGLRLPRDNNGESIQVFSPVDFHEKLDGSAGATASSNSFDSGEVVRLFTSDSDVYVSFVEDAATGPSGNSFPLASSFPEYFSVNGDGVVISVIGGVVDINKCL